MPADLKQLTNSARNPLRQRCWQAAIAFFIIGLTFSFWYVEAYYSGDVIAYARFYDALFNLPTTHWAAAQANYLGSAEPLYRTVLGFGAYFGVDRTLYISIWNAVLVATIGYILAKYRCSLLFCFLVLTNYYLLVLMGSSERLKFAYIVLILAFAVENRKIRFMLAISSPFFQTQAVVQIVSGLAFYASENFSKFAKTPLKTLGLAVASAVAVAGISYIFFTTMGQMVESKSTTYSEASSGLLEAIQWTLLLAAGLIVFNRKRSFFIGMLPMGALTVLFGNRVNVATFALFAALAILQRKTNNPLVLGVMGYMSYKSVAFLSDVAQHGTGF